MEEELKILLIPKDPNDDKDVIVEIRAAAGDEAAIFAGDLMRMYSKYAEANGFKTEIVEASESDHGGYKEVSFSVSGTGAYSKLKFENGAHRVQRVPETESGGRIHTSTATVAVLPEAEDVEIEIRNEDLKLILIVLVVLVVSTLIRLTLQYVLHTCRRCYSNFF